MLKGAMPCSSRPGVCECGVCVVGWIVVGWDGMGSGGEGGTRNNCCLGLAGWLAGSWGHPERHPRRTQPTWPALSRHTATQAKPPPPKPSTHQNAELAKQVVHVGVDGRACKGWSVRGQGRSLGGPACLLYALGCAPGEAAVKLLPQAGEACQRADDANQLCTHLWPASAVVP